MLSGGVGENLLSLQSSLNFVMLVLAWNISGGHFNPAISIGMCIATKKIGAHWMTLLIMVGAQFAGGMFGLCLGFLSILDIEYMNKQVSVQNEEHFCYLANEQFRGEDCPYERNASVPEAWLGIIAPIIPYGTEDLGADTHYSTGFTRDWQTFWAMLVTSMLLVLAYNSIKLKGTQITDDRLVQALGIVWVIKGLASCNALFGAPGINPAIAVWYMMFEATQYQNPNTELEYGELNHYVWAYLFGPICGAILGGILTIIHEACAKSGGGTTPDEAADEVEALTK